MSSIVTYTDEQTPWPVEPGGQQARCMLPADPSKGGCLDYHTDTGRVVRKFSLKDGGKCSNDLNFYANTPTKCPERAFLCYENDRRGFGTLISASFNINVQPGLKITAPWLVFAQWNCAPLNGGAWKSPPVSLGAINRDGQEMFLFTVRNDQGLAKETLIPLRRNSTNVHMEFIDGRGGQGYFMATIDDVVVMTYGGPLGYADHSGCYFAHGIYRAPWHAVCEDMLVHFEHLTEGETN